MLCLSQEKTYHSKLCTLTLNFKVFAAVMMAEKNEDDIADKNDDSSQEHTWKTLRFLN